MSRYDCVLTINLQLFAGSQEKTEKATPKRRQDARKKGQVLVSREVNTVVLLLVSLVVLRLSGGYIFNVLFKNIKDIYSGWKDVIRCFDSGNFTKLFIDLTLVALKCTVFVMCAVLLTGLAVNYAQVGFLLTGETLKFKFDRLNPVNGIKRILSPRGAVELLKAILKIAFAGYVAYQYLNVHSKDAARLMDMRVPEQAAFIGNMAVDAGIKICMALLALAIADYGYQWWDYEKNLKMSKQEIKEEYKQLEGNPEIKSKIKQKQRQMAMMRMMQEVPKADVVITNPTHFAVAVKYDQNIANAPVVVAKGTDYMALKIKEIAKQSNIEVVENKPLARTLYEKVDIGEAIPPELYQAVAEVLAFVYSLKK